MTPQTYRQAQTEIARDNLTAAYAQYDAATTKAGKNAASDEIQFWGNKLSFLESVYMGAFQDEQITGETK